MGVLPNPRHERVAQELARVRSPEEAYEIAGYDKSGRSFASNARKCACRPDVKVRVAEIQAADAALSSVDAEWIRLNAARIAGTFIDPDDIKATDVIAALNLLAKMTPGAIVPTKLEATGKDGERLIPEYSDDDLARALSVFLAKTQPTT